MPPYNKESKAKALRYVRFPLPRNDDKDAGMTKKLYSDETFGFCPE